MLAIWEPILPTDWGAPGTSVLSRLHDRRVRQFWDPDHILAGIIKKEEVSGKVHPTCCGLNRILWDLTAAYAPGARWGDTLPEPVFLNGPVVQTAPELESIVAKAR